MDGYYCLDGVYETTRTNPLVLILNKTGVLEIARYVVAIATHTTCSCSSVITIVIFLSVTFESFVVSRLSTDASCTISIGTSCELYKIFFLSTQKTPFTNLSAKNVLRRTGPLISC